MPAEGLTFERVHYGVDGRVQGHQDDTDLVPRGAQRICDLDDQIRQPAEGVDHGDGDGDFRDALARLHDQNLGRVELQVTAAFYPEHVDNPRVQAAHDADRNRARDDHTADVVALLQRLDREGPEAVVELLVVVDEDERRKVPYERQQPAAGGDHAHP